MEITVKNDNNLIIGLKGRLDTNTSIELDNKYKELDINTDVVVLDFKELEYISSAGLRVLLAIKKDLDSKSKSLEIHNINAIVRDVFNVTGFKNILNIK